jgi:hypothetical protein
MVEKLITSFTYSREDFPGAGESQVRLATPDKAARRLSIPLMTASMSFESLRYGTSETTVFRLLVIVMRPLDLAPRPRYWLMVMASDLWLAWVWAQRYNEFPFILTCIFVAETGFNSGSPLE